MDFLIWVLLYEMREFSNLPYILFVCLHSICGYDVNSMRITIIRGYKGVLSIDKSNPPITDHQNIQFLVLL